MSLHLRSPTYERWLPRGTTFDSLWDRTERELSTTRGYRFVYPMRSGGEKSGRGGVALWWWETPRTLRSRRDLQECISAYRLADGQPLWSHEDPLRFDVSVAGPGPGNADSVPGTRVCRGSDRAFELFRCERANGFGAPTSTRPTTNYHTGWQPRLWSCRRG